VLANTVTGAATTARANRLAIILFFKRISSFDVQIIFA